MTAKLLLAFASTVILGSENHGTHNHILLPHDCRSLHTQESKLTSALLICISPWRRTGEWRYYFHIFLTWARVWNTYVVHQKWPSHMFPSQCSTSGPTALGGRGFGVRIPLGIGSFSSPCHPDRFWSPSNLLSNEYRGAISPAAKRPGREADHSPQTSAKVKNTWIYTSSLPYVFMECCTWATLPSPPPEDLRLETNDWHVIFSCEWFITIRAFLRTVSGKRILWMTYQSHFCIPLAKGRAVPVTDRGGPQGCDTSTLPHFLNNRLTDGGEVVSLTRQRPFTPPGRFLVLISVRGWVDPRAIVRLEGLS
jgi:hypothetical protein